MKRSEDRNIVAAAAYRSGEKLHDQRASMDFDYSRRQRITKTGILTPEGAPEWTLDREALWNMVEITEKRKDAQLARELEISLPDALSPQARETLVWDFVQANCVALGMVADIALHGPGEGDPRNHHAHILLTLRRLNGKSFGPKEGAWNDNTILEAWKKDFERHANAALEAEGATTRLDRRSLAERRKEALRAAEAATDWIEKRRHEIEAERLNYTPRPHLPRTPFRAMVAGEEIPEKWREKVAAWHKATQSRTEAAERAAMEAELEAEIAAQSALKRPSEPK